MLYDMFFTLKDENELLIKKAGSITKAVSRYWSKIQRVIAFKQKLEIEEERQKVCLSFVSCFCF